MAQAKQFTLLLLYDKVASSLPVAQALKEKDIDVTVVQNAGELIQAIATRKADMVGLSVNHASTPSLIRVLKDKTQVEIMAFGEDKQPSTAKKIDKADVDIRVSGIANGYNIFMKIGHLVKKKEKETENARTIHLQGGGEKVIAKKQKKQGAFIVKGKAKTKKENEDGNGFSVTSQEVEELDGSSDDDSAQKESSGETLIFHDGIKENNGPIKKKDEVKKGGGALIFRKKDDAKKPGRLLKKIKDEDGSTGAVKHEKPKPAPLGVGGTIVFSDEAMGSHKKFEQDETEEKIGKVVSPPAAQKEERPVNNVIDFQARKKKAEVQASEAEENLPPEVKYAKFREAKKNAVKEQPVLPMDKLKHKKQFKEAVQKAGEKSFLKTGEAKPTFSLTTRVCVIPVINPKEKGFLLFSVNDNQFMDAEGLQKFKLALLDEMKNDAVGDFILGETFNVETFEVNISDWARTSGQFSYNFQEVGTDKEVFVCFVKRDSIYPDFKKMDEPSGVYRVHIHTMPPLTPVSFNVFLYFVKNKRLIPYLKKGGKFTARQIQRLYKRGFKFLYIEENEKSEFLSFYVSLMINQDFQSTNRKLA